MQISLGQMCGKHILTGAGYCQREGQHYWESYAAGWFVLDGIKYIAYADPSDGYRSCMDELVACEPQSKDHLFEGVEVLCKMNYSGKECLHSVILEIYDANNHEIILSVGTDNTDDYYPQFVFEYIPENMACNKELLN